MKIVVRQISGLGNQMFQYAAGRYYSERINAEMILAVDPPRDAVSYGFPRPFLLSHFAIRAHCRELTRVDRALLLSANRRLQPASSWVAAAIRLLLRTEIVTESVSQRHRFMPDLPIRDTTSTVYLVGYWQTHRIVDVVAEQLREEFTLREAPTGKNLATLRAIQGNPNSISLHIRRGDYLLEQEGNIALSMSYYVDAIEQIKRKVLKPTFFVFSDDIEFARNNLDTKLPAVFVDHNDSYAAHEDLRLMSCCRHHIIANSSFSWWGAWLNPRNEKLVFAPRKWLVGQSTQYEGLFSPNWHLID